MKKKVERLRECERRLQELKAMLEPIGFIIRGSLQTMYNECGKPSCRCHKSPANRHGPYHHWTRKLQGKTVGRNLTDEEEPIFRKAIENSRNLEKIMREMYQVSERALELIAQGAGVD